MTIRRAAVAAFVALGLVTAYAAEVTNTAIPAGPVSVDGGQVAGVVLSPQVHAYLGIPYAAPPVRDLRWRAPQPVIPWTGVLHAERPSPACMQRRQSFMANGYTGEEALSEDCLFLNVWLPAGARAGQQLPVIVYIYGGSFTSGSANRGDIDGAQMATRNLVFITINYRVGALGFYASKELAAESPLGTSGNWGLLDMVAALQWVHRNVATFGGDPGNVTIAGQSAGAQAVSMLQTSPLARGLMQRAFAMSSARPAPYVIHDTEEQVERRLSGLPTALKVTSLAELRALPADRIVAEQLAFYDPNVDKHFFPEQPYATWEAGRQNDVPLMLSFTRDEDTNELRRARTVAEYTAAAQKRYGASADEFLKLYPASTDAEVQTVGADAAREAGHFGSMMFWAAAQRKTGKAPVYLAEFSRVHPYVDGVTFAGGFNPRTAGAYHTSDIAYYFHNLDAFNRFRPTRAWTAWDQELSNKMADAVAAFAKSGSPSTPGVAWPAWTAAAPQYLEFGDTISTRTANSARIEFLWRQDSTPHHNKLFPLAPGAVGE
jgi:para-nitrobenzyl esterase